MDFQAQFQTNLKQQLEDKAFTFQNQFSYHNMTKYYWGIATNDNLALDLQTLLSYKLFQVWSFTAE